MDQKDVSGLQRQVRASQFEDRNVKSFSVLLWPVNKGAYHMEYIVKLHVFLDIRVSEFVRYIHLEYPVFNHWWLQRLRLMRFRTLLH